MAIMKLRCDIVWTRTSCCKTELEEPGIKEGRAEEALDNSQGLYRDRANGGGVDDDDE
jgi:hypothetical protein